MAAAVPAKRPKISGTEEEGDAAEKDETAGARPPPSISPHAEALLQLKGEEHVGKGKVATSDALWRVSRWNSSKNDSEVA